MINFIIKKSANECTKNAHCIYMILQPKINETWTLYIIADKIGSKFSFFLIKITEFAISECLK